MKSRTIITRCLVGAGLTLAGLSSTPCIRADAVTDWNRNLLAAEHVANVSPLVAERSAAIVQAAVFDAINGIERRYTPVHVTSQAPRGASRRAAVIQAAYASLVKLFPDQKPTLDAQLTASLAEVLDNADEEDPGESIERGIAWGQKVADSIWAWRSTDGFTPPTPPFLGGIAVGEWRPTPPGFSPGAGGQFATMTPWAILSPSQFRPPGPPSLTGARYAADFNETKSMGSASSTTRSADQTLAAEFWNSANGTYFWNSVALSLGARRHNTLLENAHLLAVLNLASADARIACWDAKYHFVFWRPVTAIPLGATDGNPATIDDPAWEPLLGTPGHPEYPSGHSTTSGAAAAVLASYFGEDSHFTVDSDWMPGVIREFSSFSEALEEVKGARIFGGIHFRTACDDGQAAGIQVANYVLQNALQRVHGKGH